MKSKWHCHQGLFLATKSLLLFLIRRTFYTLFQYWTSAPLTLILVTDARSVPSVARSVTHT